MKQIWTWQEKNNVLLGMSFLCHSCGYFILILDIIYVPTDINPADEPSRVFDYDGDRQISPHFQQIIERDFQIHFTLDGCGSNGQRISHHGQGVFPLPYVSRFSEPENVYTGIMSFPWARFVDEKVWIFAPRKLSGRILRQVLPFLL